MKNLFYIILFLTGCKYEEGPFISFRSKKNRLKGKYKVEYFKIDSVDSLAELGKYFPINNFEIVDLHLGIQEKTIGIPNVVDEIILDDDSLVFEGVHKSIYTNLDIPYLNFQNRRNAYEITKLTNKYIHLKTIDSGKKYELGFISQK